jgi:16S rRNA (uracil1498-N3)-methyltransferase
VSLGPHVLVLGPLADEVPGAVVPIPAATEHHLRRVLRRSEGSALTVTDGTGLRASAELVADGVRLTAAPEPGGTSAPRLVLAQSLAKGRRADDAVRTACELGVDRIVPIVAERTQGRPDDRAAIAVVDRWQALAVSALEQSRGVHLARVEPCLTTAVLASRPDGVGRTVRIVTVPGAPPLPDVLRDPSAGLASDGERVDEVWIAVGPEGGWSEAEVALLVGSGWLPVGLGPTVLRTEHAGPVAVAVVAALTGRWLSVHQEEWGRVEPPSGAGLP